ncbi:MAG: hypothetical protein ACR2LI_13670, partial [Propionibacteriaceae bacterium]
RPPPRPPESRRIRESARRIDWASLGIVAVSSVVATVVFALLLSLGVRLLSTAQIARGRGESAALPRRAGQVLVGLAGLLVLFCLWLIVPQFH